MKRILLFLSSLIFLTSVSALAQNKDDKNTQTKVKTKQSISEKIKKLERKDLFKVDYDKFEDQTSVFVKFSLKNESFKLSDLMNDSPTELYGIDLSCSFWFKGQELKEDIEKFVLLFYTVSRDWRWINNRDFIAIVDDERIKLGDGKRNSEVRKGGSVSESLYWSISKETLEKIANGKSVEIRIGTDEFKVKSSQQKRLKDFISLAKLDQ